MEKSETMRRAIALAGLTTAILWATVAGEAYGAATAWRDIQMVNKKGPRLGVVVPNLFEMNPLLNSKSFLPDPHHPFIDFSGRRFRLGHIKNESVIIVMTGLGMLNAGITTQLLLAAFWLKGVVHYGIAGNANPHLHIGDVAIPRSWAHIGLWNWQRYGDGVEDELALEANGDYTREIGFLQFSDHNVNCTTQNFLNRVWYQPEEVFPVDATPEVRQHAFWVSVDRTYFDLAQKLEGMKLPSCVNGTCLDRPPRVVRVERGASASVFVDNAAYREFLNSKFEVTPIDMETASVALLCLQNRAPFIAIRALSDLAGGGSAESNEADKFTALASQNSVDVFIEFVGLVRQNTSQTPMSSV